MHVQRVETVASGLSGVAGLIDEVIENSEGVLDGLVVGHRRAGLERCVVLVWSERRACRCDGGLLVGLRDPATRTIRRTYALAPLDDLLGTFRLDWRASPADDVMIRYSAQREDDIAASTVERAIGTASQRQQSRNRFHGVLG